MLKKYFLLYLILAAGIVALSVYKPARTVLTYDKLAPESAPEISNSESSNPSTSTTDPVVAPWSPASAVPTSVKPIEPVKNPAVQPRVSQRAAAPAPTPKPTPGPSPTPVPAPATVAAPGTVPATGLVPKWATADQVAVPHPTPAPAASANQKTQSSPTADKAIQNVTEKVTDKVKDVLGL